MSKLWIIRHAEKDANGVLSDKGRADAEKAGKSFPEFDLVYCSDSERTQETARLITGVEPMLDKRAGFYMAKKEKSDAINKIYKDHGVDFMEAIKVYNDDEVNAGINKQADRLNEMIDDLLSKPDQNILIVSHNITMCPAMEKRGLAMNILNYLAGFIVYEDRNVSGFSLAL